MSCSLLRQAFILLNKIYRSFSNNLIDMDKSNIQDRHLLNRFFNLHSVHVGMEVTLEPGNWGCKNLGMSVI